MKPAEKAKLYRARMKERGLVRLQAVISVDTHQALKIEAERRGISTGELLDELVQWMIDKEDDMNDAGIRSLNMRWLTTVREAARQDVEQAAETFRIPTGVAQQVAEMGVAEIQAASARPVFIGADGGARIEEVL